MFSSKPKEYKEITCDLDFPDPDITFSQIFNSDPNVLTCSEPVLPLPSEKPKLTEPVHLKPLAQALQAPIKANKKANKPVLKPVFNKTYEYQPTDQDPGADPLLIGRSEYYSNPQQTFAGTIESIPVVNQAVTFQATDEVFADEVDDDSDNRLISFNQPESFSKGVRIFILSMVIVTILFFVVMLYMSANGQID